MKISLVSTNEISIVNGAKARVWTGETEAGTPVKAWIVTISPQTHDEGQLKQFEDEFDRMATSPRYEVFDLRLFDE